MVGYHLPWSLLQLDEWLKWTSCEHKIVSWDGNAVTLLVETCVGTTIGSGQ